MAAIASNGPCPCLGRCDDPDSFFAFPTVANCCHSGPRPFPVEPPYQADNCLGESWSECPRYKETPVEGRTLKAVVVSYALKAVERFPVAWEFVAIAVVVLGVLIGIWFVALRPKDTSQAGMMTPAATMTAARPATSELGTAAAQATTQTPTQTPTLTSSPTTTPSRTPAPTTFPTSTRTPTSTASPAPTVEPSMTPSQTPSLTPSLTAIPTTAVPTATASPTATGTPFPVPELLSPEDGRVFSAKDEIVLRWQSVGALPFDAYYVVTVAYSRLGDTWYDETPWIQDTSWTLSEHDYLVDLSDDGMFYWSVQVLRQTGLDAEGKSMGIAISPSSETWSLTWKSGVGPPSPPTPPPPPP
jgi:hypothetical protein